MKDVMLIIHFIGLAMGVGTGFAFMFLGIAGSKMEKADAQRFQLNTLTLSRMGHIGLTLMIVSGVLLMPLTGRPCLIHPFSWLSLSWY